ncbi:hypothetical protein INT43_008446, partial [Umbelopsis isabellina]
LCYVDVMTYVVAGVRTYDLASPLPCHFQLSHPPTLGGKEVGAYMKMAASLRLAPALRTALPVSNPPIWCLYEVSPVLLHLAPALRTALPVSNPPHSVPI